MTDADLAVRITALKQAVSKAKAAIEQRRQEADALSKEMTAQSAANAKLQVELDKLHAVAEFDAHWQRVCREHGVVRQRTKSALPPKADMCAATTDVC
jgi:predicted RNase H-like nuclease (RuvC/YqgF family)